MWNRRHKGVYSRLGNTSERDTQPLWLGITKRSIFDQVWNQIHITCPVFYSPGWFWTLLLKVPALHIAKEAQSSHTFHFSTVGLGYTSHGHAQTQRKGHDYHWLFSHRIPLHPSYFQIHFRIYHIICYIIIIIHTIIIIIVVICIIDVVFVWLGWFDRNLS